MKIHRYLSNTAQRALAGCRHADREKDCRRLLAEQEDTVALKCVDVVGQLHSLAQSLEGRSQYAEGLKARLHARDMLIYLMGAV